jgi:hypothetical protein
LALLSCSRGVQGPIWPRVPYTAVAYLFVSLVAVPLFGDPSVHARGALAANAYYWTTLLYDLLMLFLTCFVFDAMFCCLRFVGRLSRAQCAWPEETSRLFNDRLAPGSTWNSSQGVRAASARLFTILVD